MCVLFPSGFCGDLTVALSQNAVLVVATTAALASGGGVARGEEAGLPLPRSGQLLLSPGPSPPPPPASPSSPPSSPAPPSRPPPAPVQAAGVATLTLLVTPPSSTSLCTPPPLTPASPSPPPVVHLTFDPDSFLNSPIQGQTYGGPPPPPGLCSSSALSPPSLALSLSPTSTPPSSVSPPSSLSSLSSSSSSSSPPSCPLPPSLSLSPTSSVAPALLPLCLELGPLGESQGGGHDDDDDDEGSTPPTKLALLQVRLGGTTFFSQRIIRSFSLPSLCLRQATPPPARLHGSRQEVAPLRRRPRGSSRCPVGPSVAPPPLSPWRPLTRQRTPRR